MAKNEDASTVSVVAGGQGMHIVTGAGTPKAGGFKFKYNPIMMLAAFIVVFGGVGSYLLFASHADTPPTWIVSGLRAVSDSGTKMTQLNLNSAVGSNFVVGNSVVISPNGQKVAYISSTKTDSLVVSDLDGKNAQTLAVLPTADSTEVYYPQTLTWSPDSTKLAMKVGNDSSEWIINADGTNSHHITSPDGLTSATFSWVTSNKYLYIAGTQVCTVDYSTTTNASAGGQKKCATIQNIPVTHVDQGLCGGFDISSPVVSPDATSVALVGNADCALDENAATISGIYTMSLDGTNLSKIKANPVIARGIADLAWSPDGLRIASLEATATAPVSYVIDTMNANGTNQKEYGTVADQRISWGAANSILANAFTPAPTPVASTVHNGRIIYQDQSSINPDGTARLANYAAPSTSYQRTISPDGKTMAYLAVDNSTLHTYKIMTAKPDGTNAVPIASGVAFDFNGQHLAWSPNGQWIALGVQAPGGIPTSYTVNIALVEPNGANYHTVPNLNISSYEGFGGVSWLPNSNMLVYTKTNVSTNAQLCKVSIDGSTKGCEVLPALPYPDYGDPEVSPDGSTVLYQGTTAAYDNTTKAPEQEDVYTTNISGENLTKLTNLPPHTVTKTVSVSDAVWSPDGKQIAYGVGISGTGTTVADSTAYTGLYIMNADGSATKRITTDQGYGLAWQNGQVTLADKPVPADYNGDGKVDIATWRATNGSWYVNSGATTQFGAAGDVPVPRDYNGDKKADYAVFRPSNASWYVQGKATVQYGANGDIPVPADYSGSGKASLAVFRPSNASWYVQGKATVQYGANGDIPVPGDYNGDKKADIAVFRPSTATWYIAGVKTVKFGAPATSQSRPITMVTAKWT